MDRAVGTMGWQMGGRGSADGWPESSLLGRLDAGDRRRLLALGRECRFDAEATLISQGDRTRQVYVLASGYTRVMNDSADGRSSLLAIRGSGDLVGEIAALDHHPRTATVVAATPVRGRVIDHTVFLLFVRTHPDVDAALHRYVLTKLREATVFRGALGRASVRQRLAQVLLHLAASYGRSDDGVTTIAFPFSQGTLAAFVGAAEPSVHRELTRLRRDGLVTTGYRAISINDLSGLTRIATHG